MTPDIGFMRHAVAHLYAGSRWKRRVAKMPDGQVMAIYFREEQRKADDAKAKKEKKDEGSDLPF